MDKFQKISLEELKDELIGVRGTAKREHYEEKLTNDLKKEQAAKKESV